jgi:hypothetical protein
METWLPMIIQLVVTGAIALGLITYIRKFLTNIKDDLLGGAMKLDRVMEKYLGDENSEQLLNSADEFLDLLKLAVKTMKETDSFQEK